MHLGTNHWPPRKEEGYFWRTRLWPQPSWSKAYRWSTTVSIYQIYWATHLENTDPDMCMASEPPIPTLTSTWKDSWLVLVTPWEDQVLGNVHGAGRGDYNAHVSVCTSQWVRQHSSTCFLLDYTYILCPNDHKSVIMILECTEKIILSEHVTAVKISAFHSKY